MSCLVPFAGRGTLSSCEVPRERELSWMDGACRPAQEAATRTIRQNDFIYPKAAGIMSNEEGAVLGICKSPEQLTGPRRDYTIPLQGPPTPSCLPNSLSKYPRVCSRVCIQCNYFPPDLPVADCENSGSPASNTNSSMCTLCSTQQDST
jgi:hypothetical protein